MGVHLWGVKEVMCVDVSLDVCRCTVPDLKDGLILMRRTGKWRGEGDLEGGDGASPMEKRKLMDFIFFCRFGFCSFVFVADSGSVYIRLG